MRWAAAQRKNTRRERMLTCSPLLTGTLTDLTLTGKFIDYLKKDMLE
jgi:hypothetical protein